MAHTIISGRTDPSFDPVHIDPRELRRRGGERRAAKAIALIAHDGKKAAICEFAARIRDRLKKVTIVATSTTGAMLERMGFTVERVASGPLGGDAQVAARIAEGRIASVIFFRDPMVPMPHEADVNALCRLCDVYNVPLATNPATAEMVIRHVL